MKATKTPNNGPPTAIVRPIIPAVEGSHTGRNWALEMLAGILLDAQTSAKITVTIQYGLQKITVSIPFNTLSIRI
jgi:hypothetical protein